MIGKLFVKKGNLEDSTNQDCIKYSRIRMGDIGLTVGYCPLKKECKQRGEEKGIVIGGIRYSRCNLVDYTEFDETIKRENMLRQAISDPEKRARTRKFLSSKKDSQS